MAKKAYVRNSENTAWVELASATTDLSDYLTHSSASSTYLTQLSASTNYSTKAYADSAVSLHQATSTSVHGIADTSLLATKTYADTVALTSASTAASNAVSSLIDSSPATLDTLNELAAALNDDPNFATTITNLIAEKMTSIPGVINQFAGSGSAAPTGWLFCDGQEVLISSYTSLYNALTSTGMTFPYGANTNGSGGAGSTHFRIPNFKGKVPVGKDSSQTEFDVLGETGGAKTHTLTSAEMPSHTHTQDSHNHTQNGHNHSQNAHNHAIDVNGTTLGWSGVGNGGSVGAPTNAAGDGAFGLYVRASNNTATNNAETATNNAATATNQNTGGGGAHNNLQPYIVVNYIIKT